MNFTPLDIKVSFLFQSNDNTKRVAKIVSLCRTAKQRRQTIVCSKISSMECRLPIFYSESLWKTDEVPALIPPVTYFNIYHYFIKQRSSTIEEQFLAHKSLEAEQCVKIGWVSVENFSTSQQLLRKLS